jgi:hypothetical protein
MTGIPVAALEIVGIDYLNEVARTHWRDVSTVDVVNTTTETTVFSKSIDPGALSTSRVLLAMIAGDWLNDTGAARAPTLRVKFGGATVWGSVAATAIDQGSVRASWRMELWLSNLGADDANWLSGTFRLSNRAVGTVAGIGTFDLNSGTTGEYFVAEFGSNGPLSVDTSVAQTLAVTVQHDVADASLSFRKKFVHLMAV